MEDRFGVSIKGVLQYNNRLLLRKNERREYELLGGRLEKGDCSAQQRLITEFSEESGIDVEVLEHREPWLYEIGLKNIIIIPFVCKALCVPDVLVDEDGGTLHWLSSTEAATEFMPQGYKDTIIGDIPHKSYSIPAKAYFKIIPNYVEKDYYVKVSVRDKERELFCSFLPHFHSPRDFVYSFLGEKNKDVRLIAEPISIDRENDTIILNYRVQDKIVL